jgi:hypothetical protein
LIQHFQIGSSYFLCWPWQEVVIEGQDKVFKDVIEPLESISVNVIPTVKQDIRDFGPPQQVFHIHITTHFFIIEAVTLFPIYALAPVYNFSSYL